MISETCQELIRDRGFAACYFDVGNNRTWSLRSDGSVDVGAIAEALGGGGHHNSAGYRAASSDYP